MERGRPGNRRCGRSVPRTGQCPSRDVASSKVHKQVKPNVNGYWVGTMQPSLGGKGEEAKWVNGDSVSQVLGEGRAKGPPGRGQGGQESPHIGWRAPATTSGPLGLSLLISDSWEVLFTYLSLPATCMGTATPQTGNRGRGQ